MLMTVDLNCDMGEGMETDAAIFPFISSANIACGAHAGDEDLMSRTVELALRSGVAIGAHPSYPDRSHFGRAEILGVPAPAAELAALEESLFGQLRVLSEVCRRFGARLSHVKPHGALYNRAAKDAAVSKLICRVVKDFDASLLFYGLSGSEMQRMAGKDGLVFIPEVFADRTYRPDGSLTPRTGPGALITDASEAVAQVLKMVREGRVATSEGDVAIKAQTVCLHGDGAHAAAFAELIHGALTREGIQIAAPSK